MTVGQGVDEGYLTPEQIAAVAREGLAPLAVDGRRVLVLIPDGTRTMPMPLMFELLERELGGRVAALDYLVALGTHTPMNDAQLSALVGRPVVNGRAGSSNIFNHRWDDPATFAHLGTIPARDIADITSGRLRQDVPVALNRRATEYDHVLICGPVFPHEVAGFSGGTKYLFPGIAAPEIIHFTHWLGALVTSTALLGTIDTAVRGVIDRAAALLDTPLSLLAVVVTHDGIAGMYCGDVHAAWRQAAMLSARRHIVWVDEPYDRVLAIMPAMYDDLWTAAKGVYKSETVVSDGGEVIVYAPHVDEVSRVHGKVIDEVGYHCRDYFLGQWDRFRRYPRRHSCPLDARQRARDLRRADRRRGAAHRCDACHGNPARAVRSRQSGLHESGALERARLRRRSQNAGDSARGRNVVPNWKTAGGQLMARS